ncbi:MAG: hypothetical protein AAF270_06035 [Pseudomonadota bacterium]
MRHSNTLRFWSGTALALSLLVQMAIPAGFMPAAAAAGGWIQICPDGLPTGALDLSAATHNGDRHRAHESHAMHAGHHDHHAASRATLTPHDTAHDHQDGRHFDSCEFDTFPSASLVDNISNHGLFPLCQCSQADPSAETPMLAATARRAHQPRAPPETTRSLI